MPGTGPEMAPRPILRRNRFLIIGNIVLMLVLLAFGSAGWIAYLAERNSNNASLTTSGTTSQPVATATATAARNVIFQDPLTSNTYGWADDGSNCFFQGGSYHTKGYVCLAPLTSPVADATVSVQAKQVGGPDNYPFGIAVRHASRGNFYDFVITSTGDWASFLHVNGKVSYLHPYTSNSAIHPGLNVTNTLKVVMRGSTCQFYINDTLVGQISNSSFSSGSVGITSSGPSGGTPVDAAFNNFEVDQNS